MAIIIERPAQQPKRSPWMDLYIQEQIRQEAEIRKQQREQPRIWIELPE